MSLDARTTPARADLAARALEGRVAAPRYVDPEPMVCAAPVAPLRGGPSAEAEQRDELLFGERFDLLEASGDWCWGQALRDGYVGFVPRAALAPAAERPTHRIAATLAHAFAAPDVRSAARGPYPLGALIAVEGQEGRFLKARGAGWFVAEALTPIGRFETDPVAVAQRLTGAPYLWGGRTMLGVDCSGLIQQALLACGRACPRDSDQQAASLGRPLERAAFARGDLVFWRGHAAMGLSGELVLHANSTAMSVAVEALDEALARHGEPVAWRRL